MSLIATSLAAMALAHVSQPVRPMPAATVQARAETQPVASDNADAADDPAIWRNKVDPQASLVVATDKKAGLYVYGLDGAVRSFVPAGRVNNVDLVDLGQTGIIVVASDRNDEAHARLQLYRLDPKVAKLIPLGTADGGAGEAYGVCLLPRNDGLDAFSVIKHGAINQVRISISGEMVTSSIVRSLQLRSQAEGCVTDARSNTLYVGEERVGIWSFSTDEASRYGFLAAVADGRHLVPDVEGLAIAPAGQRGGWLVASSQGDNAYALYRLPDMKPAGRVRVVAGKFGSTEETDGIAVAAGSFGPRFPAGLLVVQDGHNAPQAQNFKFVSWRDVLTATLNNRAARLKP